VDKAFRAEIVCPRVFCRLQQYLRAEDVCGNELRRPGDALINVALGGEVDYGVEIVLIKNVFYGNGVANVALDESVPRVVFNVVKVFRIAGVCQQVIVDDGAIVSVPYHVDDKVGADEACAAGYEDMFHFSAFFGCKFLQPV
jgi:hypothetical protein